MQAFSGVVVDVECKSRSCGPAGGRLRREGRAERQHTHPDPKLARKEQSILRICLSFLYHVDSAHILFFFILSRILSLCFLVRRVGPMDG